MALKEGDRVKLRVDKTYGKTKLPAGSKGTIRSVAEVYVRVEFDAAPDPYRRVLPRDLQKI